MKKPTKEYSLSWFSDHYVASELVETESEDGIIHRYGINTDLYGCTSKRDAVRRLKENYPEFRVVVV